MNFNQAVSHVYMEDPRMQISRAGYGRTMLVCLGLALITCAAALAQDEAPKVEIYTGYQWMDPNAQFSGIRVGGMPKGFVVNSTYNFTRHLGLSIEGASNFQRRANIGTIFFGPTVNARTENVSPFFHALIGLHRVAPGSGLGLDSSNGVGGVLGGGL